MTYASPYQSVVGEESEIVRSRLRLDLAPNSRTSRVTAACQKSRSLDCPAHVLARKAGCPVEAGRRRWRSRRVTHTGREGESQLSTWGPIAAWVLKLPNSVS